MNCRLNPWTLALCLAASWLIAVSTCVAQSAGVPARLPPPTAGLPALPPPTRAEPIAAPPVIPAAALGPASALPTPLNALPAQSLPGNPPPVPVESPGGRLSGLAMTPDGLTFAPASPAPPAAATPATAPPKPPTTYPNLTVNGVFQADAGFFAQDKASLETFGRIKDGADFRRARLSAKGAVTETMNYMMQMDFAFFGRPTFTDLWVESTDLPILGNVRIGQWKQPFSLEVVSSFRYTTFMERSLLFQPFTPFRHLGIGFYDWTDDLSATWAASVFAAGQDQFGGSISIRGGAAASARVTWLPYYDEPADGRYFLHLGMGNYLSSPNEHRTRFRSIPEIFIGEVASGVIGNSGQPVPGGQDGTPFFVDTLLMADVNLFDVVGTELLWVQGPLSVQSEAMVAMVDRTDNPSTVFEGAYAQVGWFLTGEHRPYDRKLGAIDRVKPFENFFRVSTADGVRTGLGAWEVAARVSYIDLNDENVRGGKLVDTTLGVNWYLNPYCKLVFNWVHAFLDSRTDIRSDTDIFAMRTQIDF